MLKKILIMLFLAAGVTASAETYKWIDNRGTVSFTDDLGKVPERYRNKVEVLGAPVVSAEVTTIEEISVQDGNKPQEEGKSSDKKEQSGTQAKEEEKKKDYGGKDEGAWKAEFAKLEQEIKSTEEQIQEQKARLGDTSKMSRAEFRGIESSIKTLETRLSDRKQKLDELKQAAAKAGLP